MANSKISALTAATTPLAGTEVLPVVQSSVTKQVSVANLTAGRSIAVNDVTASGELVSTTNNARISLYRSTGTCYFDWASGQTLAFGTETSQGGAGRVNKVNFTDAGNVEIATAAKGINFTANTPAAGMTSQLLNWYEEGTWTPTVTAYTGTITSYTATGTYTRVGKLVTVSFYIDVTNNGTGATILKVTGMPFNAAAAGKESGCGTEIASTGFSVSVTFASTSLLYIRKYDASYPVATGDKLCCTISYMV